MKALTPVIDDALLERAVCDTGLCEHMAEGRLHGCRTATNPFRDS
jgi:hypothetical protein